MKLFCLLIFISGIVFPQTIQLRGKVINSDKKPVKNLSIRFTSFGEALTTSSGEFIISIPQNTHSVDITINNDAWRLLYPVDSKIPIPADPTIINTIIVSGNNSSTETSLDESIVKYKDLERLLKEIGSTKTELQAFLERFIELESESLKMSKDIFRREFEKKEKTETAYSSISRTLNEYILRANNLVTTFELYYELSFRSVPAVENLNKAIGLYNPVYDSIYNNFNNWEAIIALTKDSALANDFSSSIAYMINEIHKPYIWELNNSIKLINEVRLGIESDDFSIEKKMKLGKETVEATMNNLKIKIPLLQNRFKEFLNKLYEET